MIFSYRTKVILVTLIMWIGGTGFSWAEMNKSCDEIHTVKVSPEEFLGDKSLTKQMSDLIAQGLRMAVQQVTATRIRGETSEMIRDDEGKYKHTGSQLKSSTTRIQLVRPGEQGAKDAAYRIQGLVFSEDISIRRYTNRDEIRAYHNCVRNQRSQARDQSRMLKSFGFGKFGGIVQGLGADSNSCGSQPQLISGKRLEADAIFEIKICDTHLGDCQSARQPYQSKVH